MKRLLLLTLPLVAILSDSAFAAVTMRPIRCDGRLDSATEVTICKNEELISLDFQLAGLLTVLVGRVNDPTARAILDNQLDWLSDRDSCGFNVGCIESVYRRRIREVQRVLGGG